MEKELIKRLIEKTCFMNGITTNDLKLVQTPFNTKIKYCLVYFLKENNVPDAVIKKELGYAKGTRLNRIYDIVEFGLFNDSQYKFWSGMIKRLYFTLIQRIQHEKDYNIFAFDILNKHTAEQTEIQFSSY